MFRASEEHAVREQQQLDGQIRDSEQESAKQGFQFTLSRCHA